MGCHPFLRRSPDTSIGSSIAWYVRLDGASASTLSAEIPTSSPNTGSISRGWTVYLGGDIYRNLVGNSYGHKNTGVKS